MIFQLLDRLAQSKKMPRKLRFAAFGLQERMSPESHKIDQLLREERVDEAQAIADGIDKSHFSEVMEARVSGTKARLNDQKIREERALRQQRTEIDDARAAIRGVDCIEPRDARVELPSSKKSFVRVEPSDDRER